MVSYFKRQKIPSRLSQNKTNSKVSLINDTDCKIHPTLVWFLVEHAFYVRNIIIFNLVLAEQHTLSVFLFDEAYKWLFTLYDMEI